MRTSFSALNSFLKCKRAYYYEYVLGLKPRAVNQRMQDGVIIHEMLRAGYDGWDKNDKPAWLDRAEVWACANLPEDGQPLWEIVKFYYENVVVPIDDWDKVLLADEEAWLSFEGWEIRTTLDLLALKDDRLALIDHKTIKDSPQSELRFLDQDFQLLIYSLFIEQEFMYSDTSASVDIVYNMIRRSVPKELTASGKKSRASKDTSDYLRRVDIHNTQEKREAFKLELRDILTDLQESVESKRFYRNRPRGPYGCMSCSYATVCERELSGRPLDIDGMGVQLQYRIALDPLAKT